MMENDTEKNSGEQTESETEYGTSNNDSPAREMKEVPWQGID